MIILPKKGIQVFIRDTGCVRAQIRQVQPRWERRACGGKGGGGGVFAQVARKDRKNIHTGGRASHLGNKEAFGAGLYDLYQAMETLESW